MRTCSQGLQLSGICYVPVLCYHSRLWWSRVYPPQQSASWYNRNRLLDFRHVVCFVVLCPLRLLLETNIFIVTVNPGLDQSRHSE